jgi:hypothetical protein
MSDGGMRLRTALQSEILNLKFEIWNLKEMRNLKTSNDRTGRGLRPPSDLRLEI